MDLNHLHLHVRDPERAHRFYAAFFGFRSDRRFGEVLFLTNERGFDLALAPDRRPARLPDWLHFGFRLPARSEVEALHARMAAAAEPGPGPLHDEPGFLFFRCQDPDGYRIEVYWEEGLPGGSDER